MAGSVAGGFPARWLDGSFPAWERQVVRVGFCSHPVRVRGAAHAVDAGTGEVLASFDSAGGPDGTLLLRCGDRRASVCPACAERYRRDTWHLIGAGMLGRALRDDRPSYRSEVATENLPEDFTGHPFVWATLTAPSFGAVHRASEAGEPCRFRRRGGHCEHGVPLSCGDVHGVDDPVVGTPLCGRCYDYAGAVLWNASVPELWQRTTTEMYRAVARLGSVLAGVRLTARNVRDWVRVSFAKVAEWQRRGVIHLHVVARLDGVDPVDQARVVPPPEWASGELLADAFAEAVEHVRVPLPLVSPAVPAAVWGEQMDTQVVTSAEAAGKASYLAKYCTKAAGDVLDGLPVRRLGSNQIADLRDGRLGTSEHARRLAVTALDLAELEDVPVIMGRRLRRNAHQAGFGGHFMTRSRGYSATRAALQARRRLYSTTHGRTAEQISSDPWAQAVRGETVTLVGDWRYVASGYATLTDRDTAARMALSHAEAYDELRHQQAEDQAIREQIERNGDQDFTYRAA